jgi:hypothetical protein
MARAHSNPQLQALAPPFFSGSTLTANIGSTVTAQLLAFKITDYALRLVIVGCGLMFLSNVFAAHANGEPGIDPERYQTTNDEPTEPPTQLVCGRLRSICPVWYLSCSNT